MKIAEVYQSVQGEGRLVGTPSVFIRTSGCNLRCWFCDTPYTSWAPEGNDLSVDDIVRTVLDFDTTHVVVTGGEPMLYAELIPVCDLLSASGLHLTIETAGTLFLPVACDLMSISPKLANSTPPADRDADWRRRHERTRYRPDVIRRLVDRYTHQLKFVIDQPPDVDEVVEYLEAFPEIDRGNVLLMPQGSTTNDLDAREAWLAPACDRLGFEFCPRQQIAWFGAARGT